MTGRLIVLEGIDGTGKTTLAQQLADALRARGREAVTSFEPTRGPYGQRIRELAQSGRDTLPLEDEINLFLQDRTAHQRELILPALEAGKDVILDRYYFSSMAYQGARGGDVADIERRNRLIAREPDLLVILELDVETALGRITRHRGDAPDLFEGREYLERVAAIFTAMDYPYLRRIDARQPTPTLVAHILAALDG